MRRKSTLIIFLLVGSLVHGTSLAQAPLTPDFKRFMSDYFKYLKRGEQNIQTLKPAYRLIMSEEDFEPRLNATLEYEALTEPEGAIVTLRDKDSGEPLEACKTPCILHLAPAQTYGVTYFKAGHIPVEQSLRPEDLKHETIPLPLGVNLFDAYQIGMRCYKDFMAVTNKPDGDAKPCYRAPPVVPSGVNESGFCIMVFDINNYGRTENIRADCTHETFIRNSELVVGTWSFTPKVERGMPVTQKDVETKVTYRVMDESGNLLPGPEGAMPKDYKPGEAYKPRERAKANPDGL